MNDIQLQILQNKLREAHDIAPSGVGVLTHPLKTFPFKLYIPLSVFLVASLTFILIIIGVEGLLARLASILQYGF